MVMKQPCTRWGCSKSATYDKPLCYPHWSEWEAWESEECTRCHWVYGPQHSIMYDAGAWYEEFPYLCDPCLWTLREESGKPPPWHGRAPATRPAVLAHARLERPVGYIYIMKLNDGSFYPGQTTNLRVRAMEHRDGIQARTKAKEPRLVYFEIHEGNRHEVNGREDELTLLNLTPAGRRRIREMIDRFREPLRLLDLET